MARLCQDRNWKSAVYLIEIDSQKRESEATRHLLQLFHKEELLGALGLGPLAWIVIEAQKSRLIPGIVGDVDILAGNLDFQNWSQMEAAVEEMKSREPDWPPQLQIQLAGKMVAESGGLVWPSKSSHVAGAEVKCAYFTDQIKSAKSSKDKVAGIRSQIDWLENMGLDRFALVDIVGTRISDEQSGGWLEAPLGKRSARGRRWIRSLAPDWEQNRRPDSSCGPWGRLRAEMKECGGQAGYRCCAHLNRIPSSHRAMPKSWSTERRCWRAFRHSSRTCLFRAIFRSPSSIAAPAGKSTIWRMPPVR